MTWTAERIEELVSLWDAGHSASIIGKKLGISKNAVVGKAHRLKLPARPSPIRKSTNTAPRRRAAIFAKPLMEAAAPLPLTEAEIPAQTMTHAELRPTARTKAAGGGQQSCAWPIGDPAKPDFHFCGRPSKEDGPYCEFHARRAYHQVDKKRR